jgi:hypothetical protein
VGLFNLKTGKALESPETQVVSDLDAMVSHPVAFRLHGQIHEIRPISVKEFYAFTNAIVSLQGLEKAEHITPSQVVDLYQRLIQSVCDSIDRSDVEKMTQAQCGALLNLIMECVTGKAQVDEVDEEAQKKSPLNQAPLTLLESRQPSKWRKLVSFLAGPLTRR